MSFPVELLPPFRAATPRDAQFLAESMNEAGDGLPLYLWRKGTESERAAWHTGMARARRDEGSFSYRNAIIIKHDGDSAGCLIGYPLADHAAAVADDVVGMFRPLQELEILAAGTWYVNAVAVAPHHRHAGLGGKLLGLAERIARGLGKRGVSLIVSDANSDAMRLYRRLGYRETARRPIVKDGWTHSGEAWGLMIKSF